MTEMRNMTLLAIALPLFLLLTSSMLSTNIHTLLSIWSSIWDSIWGMLFRTATLRTGPVLTVQQQFANQLALLQNNTQNYTTLYKANAGSYGVNLNASWSVQITDTNSTTSPVIGRMTVTWIATSNSLTLAKGIVNTSISPTYAVSATHKAFMSLSQDAIKKDVLMGLADYSSYAASNSIKYTSIK